MSGQAEGLAHLPDGQFLPPMELNCAEPGGGVGVMEGRAAPDDRAMRRPHPAPQTHGVPLLLSLLAANLKENIFGVAPVLSVQSALAASPSGWRGRWRACCTYSAGADRATGVRVIEHGDTRPECVEFLPRLAPFCASALESTRILLNSSPWRFPTGFFFSGELGRDLMDHVFGAGATGYSRDARR